MDLKLKTMTVQVLVMCLTLYNTVMQEKISFDLWTYEP